MFELSFDINGGPEIEQSLAVAIKQINTNIHAFIKEGGTHVRDNVRKNTPKFTGEARASIQSVPQYGSTLSTATIGTVGDEAKMKTIEGGRAPGATAPPAAVLLPWVRAHNFGANFDELTAAIMLSKAISRRGSHKYNDPTGQQMFELGWEQSQPRLSELAMNIEKVF